MVASPLPGPAIALATPIYTATRRSSEVRFGAHLALTNAPNQQLDLAAQTAAQDRRELYEKCIQARDELLQAANKYRKKVKQPLIDATTPHTWSELDEGVTAVCRDVEKLAAQDNKKMTGLAGRVKQAFRSLCCHAGAAQTVLSFVPGDVFGFSSVMCAGVKVIFSAMQQTALYREVMFKALEEFPPLLQDASELCGFIILDNNEDLHRRRANLYTAIFQALRHILLWFVKNSLVTSIKMVVDPTGFAERLKVRMDIVKLRSQQFQAQAMKLSLLMQVNSLHMHHLTAQEVKAMAARTKHIESQIMQSKIATFDMLEKIDTLVRSSANTGNFLKALPALSEQLKEPHQLCPDSYVDEVLRDFCYEADMAYRDCDNILKMLSPSRRQSTGKDFDEERVVAVQSNPRLRAWLVLNQPSMLLLNGRCHSQPKSEVSLVSAKIASRLLELHSDQDIRQEKDAPRVIPLLFFCGEHRDWRRDPNGSPAELAMSMLLQLVDRGRGIIPRQALEQFREGTLPENIDSICASLQALIGSLQGRGGVFVVVIIDGIKFFSQPSWREQQTRTVLSTLVSLFRGRGWEASMPASIPATLKFLFTSTARTEALEDLFDGDEILHIQRSLPGGLPDNDTKWQRRLEFQIEGSQDGG
ncbi:hypothetical protein DL771_004556 [Monosporascus sp. 5C6A]|nr:hypothetical protein DL771_004556 [Monosporascus sp. 5C6A]